MHVMVRDQGKGVLILFYGVPEAPDSVEGQEENEFNYKVVKLADSLVTRLHAQKILTNLQSNS